MIAFFYNEEFVLEFCVCISRMMLKFLIQSYDKICRQALHIKNRYYQDYSFSCNNESGAFMLMVVRAHGGIVILALYKKTLEEVVG